MNDPQNYSRTPFDTLTDGEMDTQPLPTSQRTVKTTNLFASSYGLNRCAKYVGAAAIGAIVALVVSSLSSEMAQSYTSPDRAQIVAVGAAQLVRSDSHYDPNDATSTQSDKHLSQNEVVTTSAPLTNSLAEIALRDAAPEDRARLQARVDEDKAIAERQLLEDKKRSIDRQLEDAANAERRRQDDKALEDQRASEDKQRLETRAQEDKQMAEQRQAQAQITPSLTSTR